MNSMQEKLKELQKNMRVPTPQEQVVEASAVQSAEITTENDPEDDAVHADMEILDDESAESNDGDDTETELQVEEEYIVNLPKRECHLCRHLMPNMPVKLAKKYGGSGGEYGAEFDCYTDAMCPAQYVKLIFNPFNDDMLAKAVKNYFDTGSLDKINDIYARAGEVSAHLHEQVHEKITRLMRG